MRIADLIPTVTGSFPSDFNEIIKSINKNQIYKNNKVVTSMTYNVKCDRDNSGTIQTADLGTFGSSFTKGARMN